MPLSSIRKRQAKDLQQNERWFYGRIKKGRPKPPFVLHADLFLEEIPRTESDSVNTAIVVGIESIHRSRNRGAIVRILRLDVVPLKAEPHGRVDIIGQVDEVLRFTRDSVLLRYAVPAVFVDSCSDC